MIDEKKLIEKIKEISERHPYKIAGNYETYSQYNEAWQDCISLIESVIEELPKVGEWIPVEERLPENAKHRGAFCPKYQVKTKYGITEGWYNPDVESWYCLFWFLLGRYDETDIDLEKGDKPKVIRVPDGTGIVIAWKEPSEPWEGGKE